jgi:hypothetical protein
LGPGVRHVAADLLSPGLLGDALSAAAAGHGPVNHALFLQRFEEGRAEHNSGLQRDLALHGHYCRNPCLREARPQTGQSPGTQGGAQRPGFSDVEEQLDA